MLGAPSLPCWPRGLPLNKIRDEPLFEDRLYSTSIFNNGYNATKPVPTKFAVLQSLADLQPDVDAIYRLVKKTPFYFSRPEPIQPKIIKEGESFLIRHSKCLKYNYILRDYNLPYKSIREKFKHGIPKKKFTLTLLYDKIKIWKIKI